MALWKLPLLGLAAATCLNDGIAPAQRRNLTDGEGESFPVGLVVPTWASGKLVSAVVQILIEELLGFHVQTAEISESNIQLFALAGCNSPSNKVDRGCGSDGPKGTPFHVGMEVWSTSIAPALLEIEEKSETSKPVNLGSMGYEGTTGQYVLSEVLQTAFKAEGLSLEWYRSYDAFWHNAHIYFDSVEKINKSKLNFCNATDMADPLKMVEYAEATGDFEGLEWVNGILQGKCFGDHFWYPPQCRDTTEKCLLFLTIRSWEWATVMARATAFDMPVIPADVKTWDDYVQIPSEVASLLYWWEPDPTFLQLKPQLVSYPRHDRASYERGVRTSALEDIVLEKYCSYNLKFLSPAVHELARAFTLNSEVLNGLLLTQQTQNTSAMEVACGWVQSSRTLWEEWLLDPTVCYAQFGLFNTDTEVFVSDRLRNTSNLACKACPSGTASTSLRDDKGLTHICEPCAPGTAQPVGGSTDCQRCPLGESQEELGASKCTRCSIGTYQDAMGSRVCLQCPEERTTLGLGSQSLAECVCKAGSIEVEGQCLSCPEGISCPIGSTISGLRHGVEGGTQYPFIQKGYNSDPNVPKTIYKCRAHCPGGAPGTCSESRVGITCGECPEGTFSQQDSCSPCIRGNWLILMIVGSVLLLGGFFPAYHIATKPYTTKTQHSGVLLALFGLVMNFAQNLLVVSQAPTSWPSLMTSMSGAANFMALNLEVIGISCVTSGVLSQYCSRALIFPVVIGLMALTSWVTRWLPRLRGRCEVLTRAVAPVAKYIPSEQAFRWTASGTTCLMGKFCYFVFTTMANVGLLPMMCYSHPGGQMQSLVKYTNTFCGSEDQALMLIIGWTLLLWVAAFLTLCFWASWRAPRFSPEGQAAVKFLFEDFRLDVAWFGLVPLCRGLFLSLIAVVATNSPTVQLVLLHSVMLLSLVTLHWQPWKSRTLNLTDAVSQALFLTLLGVGLAGLQQKEEDFPVLEMLGAVICIGFFVVFALIICVFAVTTLIQKTQHQSVLGKCADFGSPPDPEMLAGLLRLLARNINQNHEHQKVIQALDQLGAHDAGMILKALTILEMEVGFDDGARGSTASHLPKDSDQNAMAQHRATLRAVAGRNSVVKETQINLAQDADVDPSGDEASPAPRNVDSSGPCKDEPMVSFFF